MGSQVIDFNHDDTTVTNTGQAIVAIDLSAFGDVDAFKSRVDHLVRELRNSERMPGVERIWLPGAQSHERRADYERPGIPMPVPFVAQLDTAATHLAITASGRS